MINLQLLEDSDILTGEEWCRPLWLVTMSGGMSDNYSFRSQYGGTPENNLKWVQTKHVFGALWFGRTLGEVRKELLSKFTEYEFVVGDIPKEHQLDMRKYNSIDGKFPKQKEYNE